MRTQVDAGARSAQAGGGLVDRPFVHRFRTRDNAYIFDVPTGEILRVDTVVWEIIDDSYLDRDAVIGKYSAKFGRGEVARAYDEIQEIRTERGILTNWRPEIAIPWSKEEAVRRIETCRTSLTLNVTEKCNFRCTYCPYAYSDDGTDRHSERSMTWEVAKAAVDDFLRHAEVIDAKGHPETPPLSRREMLKEGLHRGRPRPGLHIGFYGGEPLLNFPIIRQVTEYVLEKTTDQHIHFGISTNGYLLKGEVADFLGDNNFGIRVSMDGPPAIHDKQRRTVGGSPTWAVVMDNIRSFVAKYPHLIPSLGATLGATVNVADATRALARAPWLCPIQSVSAVFAEEPYPGYNLAETGERGFAGMDELFQEFRKNLVSGRLSMVPGDREQRFLRDLFDTRFRQLHTMRWGCAAAVQGSGPMAPGGPCIPGTDKVLVSVDGTYRLCEKAPEGHKYEFGNVFMGINVDKAYNILAEFFELTLEQCGDCWCLPICPTGCYVSVSRAHGCQREVTKEMKERTCGRSRETMNQAIVAYCRVLEQNPEAFDYYRLY